MYGIIRNVGKVDEYCNISNNTRKTWRWNFFFTDCGHNMYSIRDNMAYHGCLYPGCLWKGIETTLYIRGSREANKYRSEKLKKREKARKD